MDDRFEPARPLLLFDLDDTLLSTGRLRIHRHSKIELSLAEIFVTEQIALYEGIESVLAELVLRFQVGIVTSSPRWYAQQVLDRFLPGIHFEPLVTYHDVECLKPSPEPLLLAIRLAGSSPAETIYVGNDLCDHQAATAAGVVFLGAHWSDAVTYPLESVAQIASPRQLLALMEDLGR